jgi:hypothetical protein
MLGTDGSKTTMLVGFDSPTVHFAPESLSGDDKGDRTHEHRYEIAS